MKIKTNIIFILGILMSSAFAKGADLFSQGYGADLKKSREVLIRAYRVATELSEFRNVTHLHALYSFSAVNQAQIDFQDCHAWVMPSMKVSTRCSSNNIQPLTDLEKKANQNFLNTVNTWLNTKANFEYVHKELAEATPGPGKEAYQVRSVSFFNRYETTDIEGFTAIDVILLVDFGGSLLKSGDIRECRIVATPKFEAGQLSMKHRKFYHTTCYNTRREI